MRVLILSANATVLDALTRRLPDFEVRRSDDVANALTILADDPSQAVVFDPDEWSALGFRALGDVLAIAPARVVITTRLRAESATRVLALARRRAVRVVLRGVEDESRLLGQALRATPDVLGVPAQLLSRLAPRITRLPLGLQVQVLACFGSDAIPRWVGPVHRGAGIGRRTLDRWMVRIGIWSATTLLDVARLARAWELTVEHAMPIADVTAGLGYRRARILVEHSRRYLHSTPASFATALTREDTVERLLAAVHTGASAPSPHTPSRSEGRPVSRARAVRPRR
jgi:hypothetical protein